MNSIHNNQTISKIFFIVAIITSIVFLFTLSQHTAYADPYLVNNLPIEHCTNADSHTHPTGGGAPICGGTIAYAIGNFYEGANVFAVLLQTMVGIVVTAAFFYFFWNLVKYIRDEEDKEAAKTRMGYSLAAIFVIVTLWGIIGFVRGVLGINAGEVIDDLTLPTVNFSEGDTTVYSYTITQQDINALNAAGQDTTGLIPGGGAAEKPCYTKSGRKGITECVDPKQCHHLTTNCRRISKNVNGGIQVYTGN